MYSYNNIADPKKNKNHSAKLVKTVKKKDLKKKNEGIVVSSILTLSKKSLHY